MTTKKHDEDTHEGREVARRPEDNKTAGEWKPARERAQFQTDEEREERDRQQRTDPLYLEKTRPEDPSARPGQLTRDNVNPNIPSGERFAPTNAGGIVDPNSLGMPQGGRAPTSPMQPEHPTDASPEDQKRWQEERAKAEGGGKSIPSGRGTAEEQLPRTGSINEPPGSNVYDKMPGTGAGIGPGTPGGGTPGEGTSKPTISSLDPDNCAIGDDSFTLEVHGENFSDSSVIVFAGHDEPTTYDKDAKTLSTVVDMSVWHGPDTVKVSVKNGSETSNEMDFTFNEAEAGTQDLSDPDEMEEELDEAVDEGDAKKVNHRTPPSKRKK